MIEEQVQTTSKARGRPRKFDEGAALERAIKVFWARGYDGTTIDDLVAAMGVVRPSLYATFGDKETLFMRCLEHYSQKVGALAAQALHTAPDVWGAIHGFLRQAVASATDDDAPPGCLLACVAPAVDHAKIREFLGRTITQAEALIEQRLWDAIRAGELPQDFPCAARARLVVGLSMAVALRARSGASRAALLADADDGAALVLGSACSKRADRAESSASRD